MTMTVEDVSLFHEHLPESRETVDLVITVPTFRRPDHLLKTLQSLLALRTQAHFAIVVIENDAEGMTGANAARDFLAGRAVPSAVVVAHQRGNCHAYNAGWSKALALYPNFKHLAVIDDDEIASEGWIDHLLQTARGTGADLTGGPQVPVFEARDGDAWRGHPVFTPHYANTGSVPILYSSGNVLIARRVLDTMPQPFLDPLFNFIGGGDSDFYRRARNRGFTFAWSTEATVLETTPARRTEYSWVHARSLRNGAISTILDRRQHPGLKGRLRTASKSLVLLATAPFRAVPLALRTRSAYAGLYHLQVAIGRLQAEFGLIGEQYREPEKN